MSLAVVAMAVGPLQCNCVILGDEARQAVVVDPGGNAELVLRQMADRSLHCLGILNTHAHVDHVGANHAVKQATGAPIHLHAQDLPLYERLSDQVMQLGGLLPVPKHAPVDVLLNDGDRLRFGGIEIEVIHTPGHSPGSVCFLIGGQSPPLLLSGDTLFAGGVGRADLVGGDLEAEMRSIRTRLLPLDDRTRVIPGHGPQTTIGQERSANWFLHEASYR